MPFIGNKPSAVPLTSADIADSIITSAKIVDATITNSDVASSIITGQTAETSIAGGDSVLIYDDSASALRKMTRTNFVSGIGGANTPSFLAYRTSSQNISSATSTKAQWNVEEFDTDGCYDSTTNFRFTPTTAGKYLVTHCATISAASETINLAYVEIRKNGSSSYPSFIKQGYDGSNNDYRFNESTFCISKIFDMNGTTDYVEAYVYAIRGNPALQLFIDSGNEGGFFQAFKLI